MSGKRSRDKGGRIEREIVKSHTDNNIQCEKVPLSGSIGGSFKDDVLINGKYLGEVKSRKDGSGFRTILKWLGDSDFLFLRRDRTEPIVVMEFDMYLKLLTAFLKNET